MKFEFDGLMERKNIEKLNAHFNAYQKMLKDFNNLHWQDRKKHGRVTLTLEIHT